ncbi:MAG TPA: carbamoyltransferase C-terminal domain-containing protein [Candidatus Acidoferrales bacterium]|nr:carbamoyltransferase C-terminal domain-containing protein [Candidatus Acidoferrales bacterium]
MYFLGLSALTHDSSAALLGDGGFSAAIEESKLLRARTAAGIPRAAIQFCLERTGVAWREIGAVGVASRPWTSWARRAAFRARYLPVAPVASAYYQGKIFGELSSELNNLRILSLLSGEARVRVLAFDHHFCHAASAFFASPFDRALILTLDEQGDGACGSIAIGEAGRVRIERTIPFPHSLGWIYSQVTELLGYRPHEHEHKTQWLSLTAEPAFVDVFLRMLRSSSSAFPKLDSSYFQRGFPGRLAFSPKFYKQVGVAPENQAQTDERARAALASSLQKACEVVATDLAESLRKRYAIGNLCLAGGLFLNPLLVSALEGNAGYENVFVQPAAGNEGTALGAAWLARSEIEGEAKNRPDTLPHLYLGPSYSNEEIKQVLDNCKANYGWLSSNAQRIAETVRLLLAGKIVAWFQGAAEFGPRALGNRSLLASPWAPYAKENLNDYVKHREPFRPFALSVPEEDAEKYFEFSGAARFMAAMGRLRSEHRGLFGDCALPGNLVRLHVVTREANPLFWGLLKGFGAEAPAPVLLNTSFNLFSEPLVLSPRHAVRSYFCSGTDALVIGSFLLRKS